MLIEFATEVTNRLSKSYQVDNQFIFDYCIFDSKN